MQQLLMDIGFLGSKAGNNPRERGWMEFGMGSEGHGASWTPKFGIETS